MGIDEGWIFGEWETGPWLGFRSTEKEAGSYSWLGFGDGAGGDHMVKTQLLECQCCVRFGGTLVSSSTSWEVGQPSSRMARSFLKSLA